MPVVSTSYTPIATGGAGVNPLNSFQLKDVGINIDITPRVTLDGDILIDLNVESSAQGPDKNVAGTNYPSFVTRKVGTRLRLRDGESNLLAGLLREDDTDFTRGLSRRDSRAAAEAGVLVQQQHQEPDRPDHAPDAAHHPDQ